MKKISDILDYILTFGFSKKIKDWEEYYIPKYFEEMEKKGIHYCATGDPCNISRELKLEIYKYYDAPWYMY
jgi:hypothetical protein